MKKIRRIAHNPIFIFLLIANFLFVSCSTDSGTDNLTTEQLTGEQLFRQVFFMQGGSKNILANIPTYAVNIEKMDKLDVKQKESAKIFIDEIISIIDKKDAKYFSNFKSIIQSDNPYTIDAELKKGSVQIIEAINESSKSEIVKQATAIYQKKFGSRKITNEAEFNQIKQELTKEMMTNTNVSSKEELVCVALALAAVVAAVAWETVAIANMVAVASVFVYTKGQFWSVVDPIGQQKRKLMNEEVVVNLIQNY